MKKLLVVAVLLGLGVVVYAKVIRSSPEQRVCERLDALCGGEVDQAECTEGLDEASKLVGDKLVEQASDCMSSADSCMEAAGCLVGAGAHAVDDFARGFERGKQ